MPSTAQWTVPTGADLTKVITEEVASASDENLTAEVGQAFDPEQPTRRDAIVALVVEEWRGAIRSAAVTPLSLTAGSVPPECVRPILNASAFAEFNSAPNLKMMIMGGDGKPSLPFARFYQEAQSFLESIRKGKSVSEPIDPEIDSNGNWMVNQCSSGEIVGEYDLSAYD